MQSSPLPKIVRRKPTDDDRRRSVRVPHTISAWITSPTDFEKSELVEVMAVNLSRHGVAFDSTSALPTGSFWAIEIGIGEHRVSCEIRICTCRKMDEKTYEVGAEFC